MATVIPRGNSYQVKIRKTDPHGKLHHLSKTFRLMRDATAWATKTEAAIQTGTLGARIKIRWSKLIYGYIDWFGRSSDKKRTADINTQRNRLKNFWMPLIGDKYVSSITSTDLLDGQAEVDDGTRSNSTINKYVFTMQGFLDWAARQQYIERAPKISQLSQGQGRVRWLSKDAELPRFLNALTEIDDPQFKAFITIAFKTGCRAGELLSLRWGKIDRKQKSVLFQRTKADNPRVVPLSGCWDEVSALMAARGYDPEGCVFLNGLGQPPYNYRPKWLKVRSDACLENFTFHDLRHNAASYLAMASVPIAEIAYLLGHKSLQTTMRYAHLDPNQNEKTGDRLNQIISEASS